MARETVFGQDGADITAVPDRIGCGAGSQQYETDPGKRYDAVPFHRSTPGKAEVAASTVISHSARTVDAVGQPLPPR
jgi:hypothetical protein